MTVKKAFYTFIFRIYSRTQRMFVITTYFLLVNKTRELNNLCRFCQICNKFREALLQTKQDPSYDSFRTLFIQSIIHTNESRGVAPGTVFSVPKGWTQIFVCKYFWHPTLYNCGFLPVRFMQQISIFYNGMTGPNMVFVTVVPSGTFFKSLLQYLLCCILTVTSANISLNWGLKSVAD